MVIIGGQGQFTAGVGPAGLGLEFVVENDHTTDRTEVLGVMAPFPQETNETFATNIGDFHFQFNRAQDHIGTGTGTIDTGQKTFTSTLAWPAVTTVDVLAGTVVVTVTVHKSLGVTEEITFTDDGVGGFSHSNLTSGTVDLVTGAISLTFVDRKQPILDAKLIVDYELDPASAPKYPTDWTVLTTWPTGAVRMAKGWCGKDDGTGVTIPRKNPDTGTRLLSWLKLIRDTDLTDLLPSYAEQADVTTGLTNATGLLISQVYDSVNNVYSANLLLPATFYEDFTLEDTAWMKVIRRRTYHFSNETSVSALTRDFLSMTWYLYIPHASRFVDLEVRLGNDYQGIDPHEHSNRVVLGSGDAATKTFSGTLPFSFATHGQLRKGTVVVTTSDGIVEARDANGVFHGEGVSGLKGSIDYATGVVSITLTDPPPFGVNVRVDYKHYYTSTYTGDGSSKAFTGALLPEAPSAHSLHIRTFVETGTSPFQQVIEAKDDGHGNIIPYFYETLDDFVAFGDDVTTVFFGLLLAATPVVKGSVLVRVAINQVDPALTVFARDDGFGGVFGAGITGTVDYLTGTLDLVLDVPPSADEVIFAEYGFDINALAFDVPSVTGTIDYVTGALDITFDRSVVQDALILCSYVKNSLSGSFIENPNANPLGAVGFNRWSMLLASDDITDFQLEAQTGYRGTTSTGGGIHTVNIAAGPQSTITAIPAGGFGGTNFVHEHMADGSSLARVLFLFFGIGATSAETDTFAAKKVHPLTPIPTRKTYNDTRAIHYFEGGLAFVTPEQAPATIADTTRMASTEDLARDDEGLPIRGWTAVRAWNNGGFGGTGQQPPGEIHGARGTLDWRENHPQPGTSEFSRNGHFHSQIIYYSQAWQAVRFAYHASLHGYTRPGQTLWGYEGAHKWATRQHYHLIGIQDTVGLIPMRTGTGTEKLFRTTQQFLNRGYRIGVGDGTVSVTAGSLSIFLSAGAGDPGDIGVSQFVRGFFAGANMRTQSGATSSSGAGRIVIEGSRTVFGIRRDSLGGPLITYDEAQGKWKITLDHGWDGPTIASQQWAAVNDPVPGVDEIFPRNDPRSYARARFGIPNPALQHGYEGENSSHAAQDVAFEAWNATGSWLLWDKVRMMGEFHISAYKDFNPFSDTPDTAQFEDQIRSNAWALKWIFTAYLVTKYLQDQAPFSTFLETTEYGKARDRYKEFLTGRYVWWLETSAKGLMDPESNVVTAFNQKTKIEDCKVSVGLGQDWAGPQNVGSKLANFGGGAGFYSALWRGKTISEAQIRFGELGFAFGPVWEVAYHAPYLWAMAREFRLDVTPFDVDGVSEEWSSITDRLAQGVTNYLIDFGHFDGVGPVPDRVPPGFVALHTAFERLVESRGYPLAVQLDQSVSTVPLKVTPSWPTDLPDSGMPNQIYYLRLGSQLVVELNGALSGQPHVDSIGLVIPGTGRAQADNADITTFENGMPFVGVPHGNFQIQRCGDNNSGQNFYPCFRAPVKAEGFSMVGSSLPFGPVLNTAMLLTMQFAAQFSTNEGKRNEAVRILLNWIWNSMAMSNLTGSYNGALAEISGYRIEYENPLSADILGDFPHSSVSALGGSDETFWWDQSWKRRRRVESNAVHSVYNAAQDVFEVDISFYGIPAQANLGLADIRVVLQDDQNNATELRYAVRRDPTGATINDGWRLFFKPSETVAANQRIHLIPGRAYYIYYKNSTAVAPAPWDNLLSIDGPYASDSTTGVLWNAEGSWPNDAGPNNLPLTTFVGLEPDHVAGRFGGAIREVSANVDTMFMFWTGALQPTGNFALEFQLFVSIAQYEKLLTTGVWVYSGIFGLNVPILIYTLEGESPQSIHGLFSIGAGAAFVSHDLTIPGIRVWSGPLGDGSTTSFNFTITTTVAPNSVFVHLRAGLTASTAVAGKDDGNGNITGLGIAAGSTIDYDSGDVVINLDVAPTGSERIEVLHTTSQAHWAVERDNHIKWDYVGGTALRGYRNGRLANSITTNLAGTLEPPIGAIWTVGHDFLNSVVNWRGDFDLTEFRWSKTARTTTFKVATPAVIALAQEEARFIEQEALLLCEGDVAAIQPPLPLDCKAGVSEVRPDVLLQCEGDIFLFAAKPEPLECRAGIFGKIDELLLLECEVGLAVTEVQSALPAEGAVQFQGATSAAECRGGIQSLLDAPENLPSEGAVQFQGATEDLPCAGGLAIADVPSALEARGAVQFQGTEEALPCEGGIAIADNTEDLLSEGAVQFQGDTEALPSEGAVQVLDTELNLSSEGAVQVIDTGLDLPSEGDIATIETSALPAEGAVQFQGAFRNAGCVADILTVLEGRLRPMDCSGHLGFVDQTRSHHSEAFIATIEEAFAESRAAIFAPVVGPAVECRAGIQSLLDATKALECRGAVTTTNQSILECRGAVFTILSAPTTLPCEGGIAIADLPVTLSCEGIIFGVDKTVQLPCEGGVSVVDLQTAVECRGGIQSLLDATVALPSEGAVQARGTASALPCAAGLQTTGLTQTVECRGAVQTADNQTTLSCEAGIAVAGLVEILESRGLVTSPVGLNSSQLDCEGILKATGLQRAVETQAALQDQDLLNILTALNCRAILGLPPETALECVAAIFTGVGFATALACIGTVFQGKLTSSLACDAAITTTRSAGLLCAGQINEPDDILTPGPVAILGGGGRN